MKTEDPLKSIQESLEVLKESIHIGIELRQKTIGFHCSAVAIDFLELYLHKLNAINPGKVIKLEQ